MSNLEMRVRSVVSHWQCGVVVWTRTVFPMARMGAAKTYAMRVIIGYMLVER